MVGSKKKILPLYQFFRFNRQFLRDSEIHNFTEQDRFEFSRTFWFDSSRALHFFLQTLLGGGGTFSWGRQGKGLHSRLSK